MIPLALFFFAFVSTKDYALVSKDFLLAAHLFRSSIKYLKLICYLRFFKELLSPEEAVRKCSSKYVFLEISQCSRENICVGVSLK